MCVFFFFCIVLLVFLLLYKYIFFLPFIVYLQSKQTREKVTVYWRAPFEFSWKRGFTSKVLVCCLYGSRLEAVLTHSVRASSLPERCPLSLSLYQEQRKHIQTSIWLPSACYNEEVHPAQFSPPSPSIHDFFFVSLSFVFFFLLLLPLFFFSASISISPSLDAGIAVPMFFCTFHLSFFLFFSTWLAE